MNKSVLHEAHEIIYGDREAVYGDPGKNLRCIGDFWSTFLSNKLGTKVQLDYRDVCAMMRLVKEARLINSPDHRDSQIDLCGYTALQERVRVHESNQEAAGVGPTT